MWVDLKSVGRSTLQMSLPSSSKHARVWGYIISLRSYEVWGTVCMCVSVYVCKPKHFTTSLPNMDSLGVSQKGCLQLCLPHSHFFQENTLTHFDTHTSVTHPHREFLNLAFGSSTTGLLLSLPGVSPVQKALCRFHDTHVAQRSGQKKPPDCLRGLFLSLAQSRRAPAAPLALGKYLPALFSSTN